MRKKSQTVTSVDVAHLAGTSQATVSRAFNQPENVNPDTFKKIMNAAQKLNYTPNIFARNLVSNESNLVGVIIKDFENPFYTSFIYKISQKLNAVGKKVLLFNNDDDHPILDILQEANSFQVSGLIIASSSLSSQLTEQNIPTKIPVVMINRESSSNYYCSVASDDIESSRFVADYFVDKGFHSFAFISGPDTTSSSQKRQKGFIHRLNEWGYYNIIVEKGNYTYDSGYLAMQKLIERQFSVPTAVLCANDLMGIGAIDAIKQTGTLQIPKDFALIGFDNIVESTWKSYQLSSMCFPIDQMINTAFEYLNSYHDLDSRLCGKHLFPCTLVERHTT